MFRNLTLAVAGVALVLALPARAGDLLPAYAPDPQLKARLVGIDFDSPYLELEFKVKNTSHTDIDGPANGWQSFDVSRVRARTIVVHGEQDWIVPVAQARHTASLLANSELRIFPEHGHLSVGVEALPALVDVRERGSANG